MRNPKMGGQRRVRYDERERCWYVRPSYADPVTGGYTRRRHQVSGQLTEEQAQAACNAWLKREDRLHRDKRCGSLAEECLDWVRMSAKGGLKHRTVKDYERAVNRFVVPTIGGMDVDEVDHYDVLDLYTELVESGREDGKGLSPNSLTQLHAVLRGTFASLLDRRVIYTNPMMFISRPRDASQYEAVSLSGYEAAKLYNNCADMIANSEISRDRNYALGVLLALCTGMRCGEVCALRRRDRLAGGLLAVEGSVTEATNPPTRTSPKTAKSRRTLTLAPDVDALTAAHIKWQDGEICAGPTTPIVTVDGELTRPSTLSKWFKRLAVKLDLPHDATFHSLRHTVATQMILSGEDMRTVSELLGHANVNITLGTYAHLVPGRAAEASTRWMRRIGDGDAAQG